MNNRPRVAAVLAMLALSALPALAQGTRADDPPRQNPNVPAITGDRQPVPKPRTDDPAATSTQGGATGLLTMAQRPQLREYALKQRDKEVKIQADLRVGSVLPADAGLIDIPPEFNLSRYRLAIANQKTLLVEPSTRRIEEVIE